MNGRKWAIPGHGYDRRPRDACYVMVAPGRAGAVGSEEYVSIVLRSIMFQLILNGIDDKPDSRTRS